MFIMLLSLQIIPVKEIGKILFKGQITEEEVHGCNHYPGSDDQAKLKKEGDPLIKQDELAQDQARIAFLSHQLNIAIHAAARLPKDPVAEIFTPPPNC